MQEGREEFIGAHSFNSAEQEAARRRIQELIEEHNVLNDELRHLISEEGVLIAKNSAEEVDYVRIEKISKCEIEIVNQQKEIIDEITRLRRPIQA